MKLDDLTFITSLQIESDDRLRNAITVFSFLSHKFPESKILVKEVDVESKFAKYALPEIKKISGGGDNITHIFDESDIPFNKSSLINDLAILSDTKVIFNYDVDMLFPIETYYKSYNLIMEKEYDVIYPYGCGVYQWKVLNFDDHMDQFIKGGFDVQTLVPLSQRGGSVMGFGQMMKRSSFIEANGLNENFKYCGYEDTEFLYRMEVLGYKIGRINDDAFHIEHVRYINNTYNNNFFQHNSNLWEWIRRQDRKTIENYYKTLEYIQKFK